MKLPLEYPRGEKRRLAAARERAVEERAWRAANEAAQPPKPARQPLSPCARRRLDAEHKEAVRKRAERRARGGRRSYRVWIEVVPRESLFQHQSAKKFWEVLKAWWEVQCINCGAETTPEKVQVYIFARRRKGWDGDTVPLTLCPRCAGSTADVRACAEKFYQKFFDGEEPGKHLAVVELVQS